MPKFDSYVICTSPRSGSTLLCKLLAATDISGKPESYFHTPSADNWAKTLDLTLTDAASEQEAIADIFEAVRAKGRGNTSIFGLRLQRHSVDYFLQKLAKLHPDNPTDLLRFEAAFGRTAFIHLTRMDKVEQAVSYLKAEQTGLWHQAPDGTELERISPPAPPQYDAAAIQERYDRFQAFDRGWTRWFTAEGIHPIRITYEALSADPIGTLRDLLDQLGLERMAASGVTPMVAKLADHTNADWATRFRAERVAY